MYIGSVAFCYGESAVDKECAFKLNKKEHFISGKMHYILHPSKLDKVNALLVSNKCNLKLFKRKDGHVVSSLLYGEEGSIGCVDPYGKYTQYKNFNIPGDLFDKIAWTVEQQARGKVLVIDKVDGEINEPLRDFSRKCYDLYFKEGKLKGSCWKKEM